MLGHDVVAEPLAVRRRIGLAGQFAAVDEELTGRENVEMIGRLYRLAAREARAAGGRACSSASGSPRRPTGASRPTRAACAAGSTSAASADRPAAGVLLDEPTTGLDPRSRQELWDLVDELRRDGTTVLLTTQYLDEADRLAQRIAVVDRGRIAAAGHAPPSSRPRSGATSSASASPTAPRARDAAAALADLGAGEQPHVDAPTARSASPSPTRARRRRRCGDSTRGGIAIAAIELQQPTLDDVFLTLTGRHAAEQTPSTKH